MFPSNVTNKTRVYNTNRCVYEVNIAVVYIQTNYNLLQMIQYDYCDHVITFIAFLLEKQINDSYFNIDTEQLRHEPLIHTF